MKFSSRSTLSLGLFVEVLVVCFSHGLFVVACQPGYYCPTDPSQLIDCPKGSYCPGPDNTSPTTCPAGSYCPYTNMESPITCSIGYYCPQPGAVNMTLCPFSSKCNTAGMIVPNACSVFVTPIPYIITPSNGNLTYKVTVLSATTAPRYYDFSGNVPFVNPLTHTTDIATINYWNTSGGFPVTMPSNDLLKPLWQGGGAGAGAPGHVFKYTDENNVTYTAVGVRITDGNVSGAIRGQINTYAVPMKVPVVYELEFIFAGGNGTNSTYQMNPPGQTPAVIWQIKSDIYPSMGLGVDTDVNDPTKLFMILSNKADETQADIRLGTALISPNTLVNVRIEIVLDDDIIGRGLGRVAFTVNEQPILLYGRNSVTGVTPWFGPTATNSTVVKQAYFSSLCLYSYANHAPLNTIHSNYTDRFIYFKRAQMFVRNFTDATATNYTMCN